MEKRLTLEAKFIASVNFAMQQNAVPLVRSLLVRNETEEALRDIHLKLRFSPAFAEEFSYHIAGLEPKESMEISPVRIILSTEFLFALTEKMVANIYMDLYEGENRVAEYSDTIELLTYDQWSGLFLMPELLAAFVMPNHPSLTGVLNKAAAYLQKWRGDGSFYGYQTGNPDHVKEQMAAIYAALQEEGLMYNGAASHYERFGQRIRLPQAVLEKKQGNCLDLSVLYASCLEAVDLHPLLVFKKGHAYVGCWLEEESFADCAEDDVAALEKRSVTGEEEILLLEATNFAGGERIDFERALKQGRDHLLDLSSFLCAIDIKRCRNSGIRPMAVLVKEKLSVQTAEEEAGKGGDAEAPKALQLHRMRDLSGQEESLSKQKIWERNLLDFSLRNALLNFRANKNTLQLMAANLGELEDRLAQGEEFSLQPLPAEWQFSLRDARIYEIENQKDLADGIAAEELKQRRIRSFLKEEELILHLKNMYRSAKSSIEENGSNTLFLALGFLRWFETDISERARYAPLVLIPVELVRSNRNKGYVLRSRQEDAQVNITLLEYLRQVQEIKITGLDPLPMDEKGVDLPLVFHTVRQAVMAKKGWNIENLAFLSLFSFGQFVMWNDIRNRSEDLESSAVVSALIAGGMEVAPQSAGLDVQRLDKEIKPGEMIVPLSADSSQMLAIAAAAKGESFVLHGPPGTGKSQTITNMIANALYKGKSVLFVAEKMAALTVVQNRLAGIGLEAFCLELHSNKSSKGSVLKQLERSLEAGRIKAAENYAGQADKIYTLRAELNGLLEALHTEREYGISLYTAIERYEEYKEYKGKVVFAPDLLQEISGEKIGIWEEALRQYVLSLTPIGTYAGHPLESWQSGEYSLDLREALERDVQHLAEAAKEAEAALQDLCILLAVEDKSQKALENLREYREILEDTSPILEGLLSSADFAEAARQTEDLCRLLEEYKACRSAVLEQFSEGVFAYPAKEAQLRYQEASNSWFLPKFLEQGRLLKELKQYAKAGHMLNKESLPAAYEKLLQAKRLEESIENAGKTVEDKISPLYKGKDTDALLLLSALAKSRRSRLLTEGMREAESSAYRAYLCREGDKSEFIQRAKILEAFMDEAEGFARRYGADFGLLKEEKNWIEGLCKLCLGYQRSIVHLRDWTHMRQKEQELHRLELDFLVKAWQEGRVSAEDLQAAYRANLYYALIAKTLRQDDSLRHFNGKQFEDSIGRYKALLEEFKYLSIQELAAKLSAQIPNGTAGGAASSELGILKRAIKSNGRMLSIRKLFDEIPNLLRRLCPCMLMSPISVAQYIDPAFPKFDLVIFDEASQLPTSTAVGAIARGKQAVIVGDPKQLPPTSFFRTNRPDEESMEKEDLESLLDDCLSISMPQEYLKWHYRSRHESLIAYSNAKYYENKLYTFPSPNDLISEVKFIPVEGFYDKGNTKQNKAEAEAVVAEIVRRLGDERLRKDSIGVVTFSSVQQNLIDDMLSDVFAKQPELEEIDRQSKEPVFIKNLENVQGDERDVILFSVGYGPDREGKVSMNFGPLNREGGWRRLNVAITRARKQMLVYSTLQPEQIDISRSRAEGVEGLKGFLHFAKNGRATLATRAGDERRQTDRLAGEIAAAIRRKGYQVQCGIGCSAYKMDIGIVDEKQKDSYLLGLILDGRACREAATSGDRFILQPSVLRGLGWNILRVWTLDWLDNPDKVLEEILLELSAAAQKKESEEVPQADEARVLPEILQKDVQEGLALRQRPYQTKPDIIIGKAEQFYEARTKTEMVKLINEIMELEAPISRNHLLHKVLYAWGIARSGSRVEEIFDTALQQVEKRESRDLENLFYWRAEQVPEEYFVYRVQKGAEQKRGMESISSYEIGNAIKEVLEEQISMSREDLLRETARKFGFTRLGTVIEGTLSHAIKAAEERAVIKSAENQKMVLTTEGR